GVDRTYYTEAVAYQKALKARNALLRAPTIQPTLLDAYDEELARRGAVLVSRRRAAVASLAPRVTATFAAIHNPIPVEIRYRSHESIDAVAEESQLCGALSEGLSRRRDLDKRRRWTSFGPHTDDLEINLDRRLARDHGSQGQIRSLVLALKLAELT